MAWDCVTSNFGDETANFGPRQQSGSALYEVNTIATITSKDQGLECVKPNLSCAVIGEKVCVAANQHVSFFKDLEYSGTLEFSFSIDVMTWSPDEKFLVLGDSHGSLFLVESQSLNTVFSTDMIPQNKKGRKTFQKILVRKVNDGYDIVILSSCSQMFVIREATVEALMDTSKPMEERFHIEMADTSTVHTKHTYDVGFLKNRIFTLGAGENIIGLWDSQNGRLENVDQGESFLERGAGIISGYATANGKFLILLDELHRLTVWNAALFTLASIIEEENVESFYILETEDNNNSLQGVKVVMITKESHDQRWLQVKTLPTWETVYRLQLCPTILADTYHQQESLYIVEWCEKDDTRDSSSPSLRVRSLSEALPETRLSRLLNKNKFDEAMEFAKLFNLNTELVYKMKCNYLMGELSTWGDVEYKSDETEEMIDELHTCLSSIQDIPFLVSGLTALALPTLEQTHKVLLYVKKRVMTFCSSEKDMSNSQRNQYSKDVDKLFKAIYRLTTFKQAFGENSYSVDEWTRFITCNLLEKVLSFLRQGEVAKPIAIWTRHQRDWVDVLTPAILSELLTAIPNSVKMTGLVSWITMSVIPFIMTSHPQILDVLLQWIIQRALEMEYEEKERWPVNAIIFLRSIYQSGLQAANVNSTEREATPSETVMKAQVNVGESLQSVGSQLVKLEHLNELRKKYKFYLPYNQFEQESTLSVTFRMLDRVVAIELIASALEKQIRPYMMEHGLKDDDIFYKYIKDLLERSGHHVTYLGEAPWEAKAVAVIKYINNPELKCEAIHDVMKYASLPWTQEIQDLVQSGLTLNHPNVEQLKTQCTLAKIKEILLKYELKRIKVETLGADDITRLIKFVLKKDLDTSVEDGLKIIELKSLGLSYKVDLYLFRVRFLIESDREGEAMTLLHHLPNYLSINCARRLVNFTSVLLDEPIRFCREFEMKRRKVFSSAGSKTCSYLMEKLKDHLDIEVYRETKSEFDSVLALQVEFAEVVQLSKYRDPIQREGILKKLLQETFTQNVKEKVKVCYSKIFRLADILKIFRTNLLKELAIHAASNKQVDTALDLCNQLLETDESNKTGDTVYEVARSLSQILSDGDADLPVELLHKLPAVLNELASQALITCSPELIGKCLSLCKVTDLSRKLSCQCETGDYSLSVQAGDATCHDPYSVWRLDPMFREDTLVLDSRMALPLASHVTSSHLELVDFCSSHSDHEEGTATEELCDNANVILKKFASNTQKLTSYLLRNGHIGLSLDYLHQMLFVSVQFVLQQDMGYPIDKQNVKEVISSQRKLLSELSPIGLSRINELTATLVSKLLNEHRVDYRLALACLLSLPSTQSKNLLVKTASSTGLNYKTLMSIAQVGIALGGLLKDQSTRARFNELEKNAVWGHRLSKYKINFREAFMAPSNEKTKLLPAMAQCEVMEISFIKDFCRAFQIEEDEGLFLYLEHLLLARPPVKLDPESLQEQQAQLSRARSAIKDIHMKDFLMERLQSLLERINPYNYEVIQFVLEEILKLSPMSVESTTKGLELLKHLKYYRRCSPPTEEEISGTASDDLVGGIDCLHPLCKERLPYHYLMYDKPQNIIKPELNYQTVASCAPIANLLEISPDSVYMAAINNTVQCYLARKPSPITPGVNIIEEKKIFNWKLDDAEIELLTKLREMFFKLSSCEIALACCVKSVINVLPTGAMKVVAMEQCVNFAEMWFKASAPDSPDREKAMKAHSKFTDFFRRLSTEQVLYQNDMAEQELLQLALKPKVLLKKLYEHPSILLHDGEIDGSRPDIHDIAEKIASIHSIDIASLIKSLIMEWLPGSGTTEDDAEATMTFNFKNLDFAKDDTLIESEESTLRRVIYLLQFEPLETSCRFLYHYVTNTQSDGVSKSNECLVRALRCLLELADDKTIESLCAQPVAEIRERLAVMMYLVELEKLHIQHTVETFSQCNKEGLIKGIWQNHSHKKTAVQLVADLCLDYKIYDVFLWNSLLQKLEVFGLMKKLENLLLRITDVHELWKIPCLSKMWQDVVSGCLAKDVPPLQGDQIKECCYAINLLMLCPSPEELDLTALSNQCLSLDMYACSLACIRLMTGKSEQITQVQKVLQVGLTMVLTNLSDVEEHGLMASTVTRVAEVLLLYSEMTGRYDELLDSERRGQFVHHMISKGHFEDLLTYLQEKRPNDIDAVLDIYLKSTPRVNRHLKMACQGKQPGIKLQIVLKFLDGQKSLHMNGSV